MTARRETKRSDVDDRRRLESLWLCCLPDTVSLGPLLVTSMALPVRSFLFIIFLKYLLTLSISTLRLHL
ncbi:hypothetical protein F5050DRAFT_1777361 [Lentinula boryana]|uniref:Uncharacterized protein n=1 Tax=Lentinula boryana TaxID=40481 RepID=A0ABQ8Q693_9AGAR|nr:hypothetical protein F5050DRAFT_1777361 [Lentinula boryana]